MTEPDLLTAADAAAMAAVHGTCFPRPWTAKDLCSLLESPGVLGLGLRVRSKEDLQGFILMRVVAGEAEVLTLAVRPADRRQGLAARILEAALLQVTVHGATRVFLEVAADNGPARALYDGLGFCEVARRKAYYEREDGSFEEALVLSLDLDHGGEEAGSER